jgi:hypothetical protein
MSEYPAAGLPRQGRFARKTGSRRLLVLGITLLAVIIVLGVGDRVAKAVTENRMAQQIQQQGFPSKPAVSIQGFPFLTQLAGRDFHHVTIKANGVTAGPVVLDITATLTNMHLNSSFSGATVDHIDGVALISFAGLASAVGGDPSVSISAAGSNEVKINVDLGIASGTATARVTKVGPNKISIKVISTDGIPSELLGSLGNLTIDIPPLPMGMTVQDVSVSGQGVSVRVTGNHVTFKQ